MAIPDEVHGLLGILGFPFGPFPDEANAMPGFVAFFQDRALLEARVQLYLGMKRTGGAETPVVPNNVGAENAFTVSDFPILNDN